MRFSLFLFLITMTFSCTQDHVELEYGVQPNHGNFVPARTAILKCRGWPNGARYKALPLTNFGPQDIKKVCKRFDAFVIDGFQGQPYMRGISPKSVYKVVSKLKGTNFFQQLDLLWQHKQEDCQECEKPPTFYSSSISQRTDWRMWLNELSQATKSADAVLIPLVTYGFNRTFNDRGIQMVQKVAGITLFLIDTNNGYLLWAGGRQATASNQQLIKNNRAEDPDPPDWKELYQRLFTEEVWREFPGRQVFH